MSTETIVILCFLAGAVFGDVSRRLWWHHTQHKFGLSILECGVCSFAQRLKLKPGEATKVHCKCCNSLYRVKLSKSKKEFEALLIERSSKPPNDTPRNDLH